MDRTKIDINEDFGRHIVLTGDVNAGEIVVEELPFAIGPKQNTPIVCLNCYTYLAYDKHTMSCKKCSWPLCAECQKHQNPSQHRAECAVFTKSKATFFGQVNEISGICTQLDCITPLRVLLMKEEDPDRWRNEVEVMESHTEPRRLNDEIWNADVINVARYLRGPCKLNRFSEELIMQVIGILEVNGFEGKTSLGYPFRCLYPTTGILAHNCIPNTTRSIYPSEGYRIRLRAMVDLKKGQQLNHSYTYTLNGTRARQEHLKSGKYFICKCERCSDPTELGTHFSSFKCSKCDPGLVYSSDPFDPTAEWLCSHCEFKTFGTAVEKAVNVMQSEIDEVQNMETGSERLENTEKLFKKFKSILHPMHFILTGLRQGLIEMYGRVEGYGMAELPDVILEHKKDLCELVLKVLDKFEKGISRSRALILYEMHVPIVLLAKSGFIAEVIQGEGLKKELQKAVDILKECVDILQYEDPHSQEGVLGAVARTAMEQLKISIENL